MADIEGKFMEMLKRNNEQIKTDRAESIGDAAEIKYRRKVEDIEALLKDMRREQENMLDLSPEDTQTLVLASDFDADRFVDKDVDLGIKIRNTEIKLEIAKKRYEKLFGS